MPNTPTTGGSLAGVNETPGDGTPDATSSEAISESMLANDTKPLEHVEQHLEFLDHIQRAGYRILYAGQATVPNRGTRRAWVECRKYDALNEHTATTVICDNCDDEFTDVDALSIAIFGPGDIRYTCPHCGCGTNGPPPEFSEE
jgi:uncharacterized protein YciI